MSEPTPDGYGPSPLLQWIEEQRNAPREPSLTAILAEHRREKARLLLPLAQQAVEEMLRREFPGVAARVALEIEEAS